MATVCPKCHYTRTAFDDENVPDWKCPKCEIAYAKFQTPESADTKPEVKENTGYNFIEEWRSIKAGLKASFVPEDKKESGLASGLGIAAIIIGSFGLMGSLVPFFGVVGLPLAGLGFFIALLARFAAINTTSTGLPNAGLVVCALPFIWQFLFVLLLV
jgi:hypothetical protein